MLSQRDYSRLAIIALLQNVAGLLRRHFMIKVRVDERRVFFIEQLHPISVDNRTYQYAFLRTLL